MNKQIQDIAKRLYGIRDSLGISSKEISEICKISENEYLKYESGYSDIPMDIIKTIAKHCNVELSTILFGQDPKVKEYFITRSGLGTAMERTKAYKYQSLAAGFKDRKADPFIVTVEPDNNRPPTLNSHDGQEFNYVIEGTLLLYINNKEIILNEGDSIYYDSSKLHGMKAMNDEKVRFIAIII